MSLMKKMAKILESENKGLRRKAEGEKPYDEQDPSTWSKIEQAEYHIGSSCHTITGGISGIEEGLKDMIKHAEKEETVKKAKEGLKKLEEMKKSIQPTLDFIFSISE